MQLIQVSVSLRKEETRKREVKSLFKAMQHYKMSRGTIVTREEEAVIRDGKYQVQIVPVAEWLLTASD